MQGRKLDQAQPPPANEAESRAGDQREGLIPMPRGKGPWGDPGAGGRWRLLQSIQYLFLIFPRVECLKARVPLCGQILPHGIILVGIKQNCQEILSHHKEDCLIQLSLCFPTVITLVINLCHLTVLHFEKRKWKKDRFQTHLHHSLKSQNRVNQMSNLALSHFLK